MANIAMVSKGHKALKMITRLTARMNRLAVLLSLPACLTVLALFAYPFLYGLIISFHGGYVGEGPWTLDNYSRLFTDHTLNFARILGNTFTIALPTTLASVLLSIPLAYYMRHGIRAERLITIMLILPITAGTVMVAQAMLTYFNPRGWFGRIFVLVLSWFGIKTDAPTILHTPIAVDIALMLMGFPFVFLLVLGYMSAVSPDLERASRMLGANEWQTFWRINFPLSLPGIAIAFSLNFVANFSVFPTAVVVGDPNGASNVVAYAAWYQAFVNYNLPMGTSIAIAMGFIQLAIIGIILWLQRRFTVGSMISGGKGA
jgi:putative spermidine/putrescine transport system permease protein